MGEININLKTAADSLNSRATRGIVMLVLDNTAITGCKKYNRKRAVTDKFTDANMKIINKCFDKYKINSLKIICYDSSNSETLKDALKKIDRVKWNYLTCPTATSDDDKKLIVDFIKSQITDKNFTVKAVVSNYKADYENIVSNYISSITIDGETLTGDEFTVDYACMCAACGIKEGLSNKILSGVTKVELIDDALAKDPQGITDLGQVGVIYDYDFEAYVLTDDVTTKTTIDLNKENESLKDRRVSEILSMMQDDIKMEFKTNWYDKVGGSYSNRKLFKDKINNSYLIPASHTGALNGDMENKCELDAETTREYLENTLKVDTTDMEDEDILAYDIGEHVFAKARIYVLRNMKALDLDMYY